jgi:UDP-glucose 4-epimerase
MLVTGCNKLVFSSTASVYANPKYLPIDKSIQLLKSLIHTPNQSMKLRNI